MLHFRCSTRLALDNCLQPSNSCIAERYRLAWSPACGGSSRWSWSPRTRLIWRLSSPSREWTPRSRVPKISPNRRKSSTARSRVAARRRSSGWDCRFCIHVREYDKVVKRWSRKQLIFKLEPRETGMLERDTCWRRKLGKLSLIMIATLVFALAFRILPLQLHLSRKVLNNV